MLIVDGHEDMAWNIIAFGRDYTLSVEEIRSKEINSLATLHNDDTMLGWHEYQRGQIALIFATLFASPMRYRDGEWDKQCYADTGQAERLYRAQFEAYERLVDEHNEKFRLITTKGDLLNLIDGWKAVTDQENPRTNPGACPVGLALLMEGAEGIQRLEDLEDWWAKGIRIIGPAWSGTRFCGGTGEPGPLTSEGYELLEQMAELGFGLDLSHMDEQAALQALDFYPGQILASHGNPLALLRGSDSNRHLSDRLIQGILERNGVIGIVPYNVFLKAGWKHGDRREEVHIQQVVAHIDYVCQITGDALHAGIGSDFDGGFGLQSVPVGIDSIADLQKLAPLLVEKGFSNTDIAAILGENWITLLQRILPSNR